MVERFREDGDVAATGTRRPPRVSIDDVDHLPALECVCGRVRSGPAHDLCEWRMDEALQSLDELGFLPGWAEPI